MTFGFGGNATVCGDEVSDRWYVSIVTLLRLLGVVEVSSLGSCGMDLLVQSQMGAEDAIKRPLFLMGKE